MRRFAVAALVVAFTGLGVLPAAQAESVVDSVRAVLMKLGQSLTANDKDGVAQALAEDAVFIDSDGEQTSGRANIAARLHSESGSASGSQLVLHPEVVRELSPDAASVIGAVSRDRDGIAVPLSRFTANVVRTNGVWQISSATETALKTIAAENLAEFKWLEGKWSSGEKKLSAEFLPGKNFLQLKIQQTSGNAPDICILGWDAAAKGFVSWQFHSDGSFITSNWTRSGNNWMLDSTGENADGERTRALSVLSPVNADEFTFRTSSMSPSGFGGGGTNAQPTAWRRDK